MQFAQGVAPRRSTRRAQATRRYSPYGSRTTSVQPAPVQPAPQPPRASMFIVYDFPYAQAQVDSPAQLPTLPVKSEVEDAPTDQEPTVIKTEIVEAEESGPTPTPLLQVKSEIQDEPSQVPPAQIKTEPAPEVQVPRVIKTDIEEIEEPVPSPFGQVKTEIQEELFPVPPVKTEPAPEVHQESVQEFLARIYSEVQMIDNHHQQRMEELKQRRRIAIDAICFTHN